MSTEKHSYILCKYTGEGRKRCKKRAILVGFCRNHQPDYRYPILDTSRAPRNRIQDAVAIASTFGTFSTLISVCIRRQLFGHLEDILCELLPAAIDLSKKARSELGVTDSDTITIETKFFEWYQEINRQEIEYRIFMAFLGNHDIFYNNLIHDLREQKGMQKVLEP